MTKNERRCCALGFAAVIVLSLVTWGFTIDDAYIGFRYVENALHGRGFVFNPPDRVEGVSNIGWLFVLLPFAFFLPVTVAAKLLSIVLVLASMILLFGFASRALLQKEHRFVLLLLPFLLATNLDFTYFSLTGMETPLAAAGLVLMVALAERRLFSPAQAVLGAFLFLVRPECILFFPLVLLIRNGRSASNWRRAVPSILVFTALIAFLTLARKLYFGEFLPNTFFAKSTSWGAIAENALRFIKGANTNISFPFLGWLALPVWANGLRLFLNRDKKSGSVLAGALLTGLLFALYAKPDWTEMGRYFAPYVPLAMFIFLCGLADFVRRIVALLTSSERAVPIVIGLIGAALVSAGCVETALFLQPDRLRDYPGYVLAGKTLIEPCLWIRDHLPDGAVIAAGRIGAVGYFSKKRIFDYKFGLTEPSVARLRRTAVGPFEDPRDPALAGAWAAADPGYFLEDLRRIRKIFHLDSGKIETLTIHGRTYRPLKTFSVGIDAEWVLSERNDRLPGQLPVGPLDNSPEKH